MIIHYDNRRVAGSFILCAKALVVFCEFAVFRFRDFVEREAFYCHIGCSRYTSYSPYSFPSTTLMRFKSCAILNMLSFDANLYILNETKEGEPIHVSFLRRI